MSHFNRINKSKSQVKDGEQTSTTLAAVALQDHLVRSLNLNLSISNGPARIGPRKIGLGPAAKAKQKQKKEIRSLTDTGLNRNKPPKQSREEKEKEYVLDAKPAPLTLAQKFGLIEAPEQPLTESDWQKVKDRSNKRDDSRNPCVICKEDFGTDEQVLLSCTHVFHRACLQAFERFTGKKTCPMCRREEYQTRVIYEGSKQHRHKCATRIQAAWRGYVVKCWYKKLRESVPPSDPKLRKKYYADRLSSITDRIVKSCDFNIDIFLTEIDENLAASRDIFRSFDAAFQFLSDEQWDDIQLKAVQRENRECPICLGTLQLEGSVEEKVAFHDARTVQDLYHSLSNPSTIPTLVKGQGDSNSAYPKTLSDSKPPANRKSAGKMKGNSSVKTDHSKKVDTDVKSTPKSKPRKTVLLSCSHVFHHTCLETFEDLNLAEGRPVCPVCRSLYQKRVLDL